MDLLLADDHVMFRDGVRPIIKGLMPDAAVHEAGSYEEVERCLTNTARPVDVALMDLGMPGMGVEKLLHLSKRHPGTKFAVLSANQERDTILRCLEMGACGYIPKRLSAQAMISALRLILAGERFVPSSLFIQAQGAGEPAGAESVRAKTGLTSREWQILGLLREGMPNKVIARNLDLTEVTIKSHLSNIFRKLGVQNRVQAARYPI